MGKHDLYRIEVIKDLIRSGNNNKEIAEKLGCTRDSVSLLANRYLGGNPNYRRQTTKHKHLRGPVMEYFLCHSAQETQEHFGLTYSEFKSIMTVGYRDPEFKHLRKDQRTKAKWSEAQILEMLKCIGLLNRNEIAQRIGRGSARVVKEKLQNLGFKYPKYINGLTMSSYRVYFDKPSAVRIVTTAGPGRGKHSATFFKIVPWCWILDAISVGYLKPPNLIKQWAIGSAQFQRAIHGLDVYKSLSNIVPIELWEVEATV